MKSRERKVIILKNLKSPHFEQAFFVLKDGSEECSSAVYEAERIIEEYIFPSSCPVRPPERKIPDFVPFAVTAAVAVIAGAAAVLVNVFM